MAEIILGAIFLGTFYFVFKAIWNNVTTVSYNGLEGFFKSWGNQLFWAFMIAAIVTTIAAKILESILDFGRSLDFDLFDIICGVVVLYFIIASFAEGNLFDKKIFRENYNRNIAELSEKIGLNEFTYIADGNPGNLINVDDKREGHPLSLSEDFVSTGSSKLILFPSMYINHSVNKSGNYTSIKLSLKHLTCDDEKDRSNISDMEQRITEITFTAAIEAVAKGKSHVIENALNLINGSGACDFMRYGENEKREYTTEGVTYIVSRNNDYVSLKMTKVPSEGN